MIPDALTTLTISPCSPGFGNPPRPTSSLWTKVSSVLDQPAACINSTFNDLRNTVTGYIDRVWPSTSPSLAKDIEKKLPLLKEVSRVLNAQESKIGGSTFEGLKKELKGNTHYVWPLIKKLDLNGSIGGFLVRWGAIPVVSSLPECAQNWIVNKTPDFVFNKGVKLAGNWLREEGAERSELKNEQIKNSNQSSSDPKFSDPMLMVASLLKASNNASKINASEIKKILIDYLPAIDSVFDYIKNNKINRNVGIHALRAWSELNSTTQNEINKPEESKENKENVEKTVIEVLAKFLDDDSKEIVENIVSSGITPNRKRELINLIPEKKIEEAFERIEIEFHDLEKNGGEYISFAKEKIIDPMKKYRNLWCSSESEKIFIDVLLKRFSELDFQDKRKIIISVCELGKGKDWQEYAKTAIECFGIVSKKLIQQFGDELSEGEAKDILGSLKDNVGPMSLDERNAILSQQRNDVLSGIRFSGDPEKPIKAGTIGEVHLGKNRENQDVVIKIMRKGLEDQINKEYEKYYKIIDSLKEREPDEEGKKKYIAFEGIFYNLKEGMLKELKFDNKKNNEGEKNNTEKAKKIYETSSFMNGYKIKVPKVYGAKDNILVQEYVKGKNLQTYLKSDEYLNKSVYKRKEILNDASNLLKLEVEQWMKGVIRHGFIEADRHSGNTLYNEEEKTFYMIDFGASSTLDPKEELYYLRVMGAAFQAGRPKAFRKGLSAFVKFSDDEKTKQKTEQLDKEIAQCFSGLTVLSDHESMPTQGVNDVVIQKKSVKGKGDEILVRIFNKNGQHSDIVYKLDTSDNKLPEDVLNAIKSKLDGNKSKLSDHDLVKKIKLNLPHYFSGLTVLPIGNTPLPTRGLNDLVIKKEPAEGEGAEGKGKILVRIFDKNGMYTDFNDSDLRGKLPEDVLKKIDARIENEDNKANDNTLMSDHELIEKVISGLKQPPLVDEEVQFLEVLQKISDKVLLKRGLAAPEPFIQLIRGASCLGNRIEEINNHRQALKLPIMDSREIFYKAAMKASMDLGTVSDVTKMAYRGIKKKAMKAFHKINKRF